MKNKELEELTNEWFYSDLDIAFIIMKNNRKVRAVLESDVSYYHERGPEGVTINTTRSGGDKRKLEIVDGNKKLIDELYDYCGDFLKKDEMFELLENLENKKFKLLTYDQYDQILEKKRKHSYKI